MAPGTSRGKFDMDNPVVVEICVEGSHVVADSPKSQSRRARKENPTLERCIRLI